ncbi:hypothetical protein TEA_003741 [Camellia sinensis var. sinensis]|uniref:THO1-MOS11 C-terminal domain-containing protein n=1 Tax=Camellia sinensis var. sinensis TaxID=542762 RepID=A0A4S4DNK9_CAMSN|nr:hypothetical protein TEA_003741 [Camellia sinensis var. sinensis]
MQSKNVISTFKFASNLDRINLQDKDNGVASNRVQQRKIQGASRNRQISGSRLTYLSTVLSSRFSHLFPLGFQISYPTQLNSFASLSVSLSSHQLSATSMATVTPIPIPTTQKEENPSKTPDPEQLQDQPPSDPPSNDASIDESKTIEDSPVTEASTDVKNNDESDVSDTKKKIRRAERFGMPVQLSEQEKRNSRAERGMGDHVIVVEISGSNEFGTVPATNGSDALKKSEDQKRKARAERFGIVQSVSADEEVKKKARLARFAAAVPKTDPEEEEKKKARALRFSQPPSDSLSQVNDKGNDTEMAKDSYHKQGWWGNLNILSSILGDLPRRRGSMKKLSLVFDISVYLLRPQDDQQFLLSVNLTEMTDLENIKNTEIIAWENILLTEILI